MKCKYCNGTGTSNTCVNGTFKPCTFCDGTGEYEPFDLDVELDKLYPTEQTNEEWLRSCTTEQLAEVIGNIAKNAYQCCQDGKTNKCVNRNHCTGYCDYGWEVWLKQPHWESVTYCND